MNDKRKRERSNLAECRECEAKCCRYFGLEIDPPEDYRSRHDIRWYLAHEKTWVYVERKRWYLEVQNRCSHLTADLSCEIYPRRPRICREYSPEDCEHAVGHFAHSLSDDGVVGFDGGWSVDNKKRRASLRRKRKRRR